MWIIEGITCLNILLKLMSVSMEYKIMIERTDKKLNDS